MQGVEAPHQRVLGRRFLGRALEGPGQLEARGRIPHLGEREPRAPVEQVLGVPALGGERFEAAVGAQLRDEKALDFLASQARVEEKSDT